MPKILSLETVESFAPECAVVTMLDNDELMLHWPTIVKELERVPQFWSPWWTLEALQVMANCGALQVWAAGTETQIRFVLMTRVQDFPAARILTSVVGFGEGASDCWPALHACLQRFAVEMECERMEVYGRQGWTRVLAPFGFKQTSVVLSAEVPNKRLH